LSNGFGFMAVAVATGAALGVATVSLSALLPAWCGLAWVGLGTGIGYAACNLPAVFLQEAGIQAWIGAGFAVAGALALPGTAEWKGGDPRKAFPVWAVLAIFTALVWMDSAAFFIIQHAGELKSGTWGAAMLWRNAAVHLVFAIMAGWWLSKGGAKALPASAWVLLAVAALAVNSASTRPIAGWFYPAAVSLYSTALVAWPGWFSGASGAKTAAWRAAWLFAIAGWFGSANGIGMAQTLQHVPPVFVAIAGTVVLAAMSLSDKRHWRVAMAIAAVGMAGWIGGRKNEPAPSSAAMRGRQVYVSEGCINCHSQYVRPGSPDEEIWGPAPKLEQVLKGEPVLIGNRRHGPDLTNVGARRSEAWLKAHFINPRSLAPDSVMPSYAHLFEDRRGDDLVRYLKESGVHHMPALMAQQRHWQPRGSSGGGNAASLYARHCAACHGDNADGKGPLAAQLNVKPPDLRHGPFVRVTGSADLPLEIACIIKFGVIGSDMPGHETLGDADIMALADMLAGWRRK
jgi:cytochrome c oxidase cbb3-type subunit 2